jgi:hypothetical protein
MIRTTLFTLAVLLVLPAPAAEAQKSPFTVPRRVFADLLKIPLEPPDVNPTVHSTREEEGLIIEDVSWPSIDGDMAPAFMVRPAKAAGRLPAVVCLHGSSTNLWAPQNDIGMPNEGVDRFLEVAEPAFKRAGAADRLVVHRPPGEHAMTIESFEAAFQFFEKFLKDK